MRLARLATLAALPFAASLGACVHVTANDWSDAPQRAAVGDFGEATLVNAEGANIGRAILTQGPTGLLIRIEADGLTPGWHGAHIHATGQCAAPFTSAGGHINHGEPKAPHGLLNAAGPALRRRRRCWAGRRRRVPPRSTGRAGPWARRG